MNLKIQNRLTKTNLTCFLVGALFLTPLFAQAEDPSDRVTAASQVFKDLSVAESGLPINVLNKSDCVIILPSVKKASFIVGAQYGKGVMVCRSGANFNGPWGAPIMMQSSGGSFGLQAGGQATDL